MNIKELTDFKELVNKLNDDYFWVPFFNDPTKTNEFNDLLFLVKDSCNWPKEKNKEKGSLLESLAKLIINRFVVLETIDTNYSTNDNEIDIVVKFNEKAAPGFIINRNCKFIIECKNVTTKRVDVGNVSKLVELCDKNRAGLGIFISLRGISGNKWRYAEGKRRKLFLSTKIPIISFTLDEIMQCNEQGINFYSLIIKKYNLLVDELEDDSAQIYKTKENDPDFITHLYDTIKTLHKFELLTTDETTAIVKRINKRYDC